MTLASKRIIVNTHTDDDRFTLDGIDFYYQDCPFCGTRCFARSKRKWNGPEIKYSDRCPGYLRGGWTPYEYYYESDSTNILCEHAQVRHVSYMIRYYAMRIECVWQFTGEVELGEPRDRLSLGPTLGELEIVDKEEGGSYDDDESSGHTLDHSA